MLCMYIQTHTLTQYFLQSVVNLKIWFCTRKEQRLRTARTFLKKNKKWGKGERHHTAEMRQEHSGKTCTSQYNTYYSHIRTASYWFKCRWIDQQNRIESSEINSHTFMFDLRGRQHYRAVGKGSDFNKWSWETSICSGR